MKQQSLIQILALTVLVALAAVTFYGVLGYRISTLKQIFRTKRPSLTAALASFASEVGAVTREADVKDIATIWSKRTFIQAEKLTFWHNFEGEEGSNMPIIRKDDLEGGEAGADTIKTTIFLNLTGAGLTGDTTLLDGNEEKLVQRVNSFSTSRLKHAVRLGDLAILKSPTIGRPIAKQMLARWLAGKVDDRVFSEFTGQAGFSTIPTKNKWAAGTAATRDQLQDTDPGGRLTWDEISRIKAYAQTELKMEPIRLEDGQEIFGFVLHPYAALSLKTNDTKYQQHAREAREAGANNPLFTGALLMVDGVVLYEAQRTPRSVNAHASPIQVADNIFFGAQAMSRGYLRRPVWREQEFSYGEEWGVATIVDVGQKLNIFDLNASETTGDATDDTAIGSMVVYTSAPAPTQP